MLQLTAINLTPYECEWPRPALKEFNPSEPRDDRGRWTSGGAKPSAQHTAEIGCVGPGGREHTLRFKLSAQATALHNDDRWVWETDDLLSAADGHRPAGFSDTENARKPSAVGKINALLKEFGLKGTAFPIIANGKREGVTVIRDSNLKDPDLHHFMRAVSKYNGEGTYKLTADDDRVLGKWLGFPKAGTEWVIGYTDERRRRLRLQ
jgi:hypothetical protein